MRHCQSTHYISNWMAEQNRTQTFARKTKLWIITTRVEWVKLFENPVHANTEQEVCVHNSKHQGNYSTFLETRPIC